MLYITYLPLTLCIFFTASSEEIMELSLLVYIAERNKSSVNYHWITHIGKLRYLLKVNLFKDILQSKQSMHAMVAIIVSEGWSVLNNLLINIFEKKTCPAK